MSLSNHLFDNAGVSAADNGNDARFYGDETSPISKLDDTGVSPVHNSVEEPPVSKVNP
jgi:hypothetical protein